MLFRIQYLPPLLIYASAGVSSLTNIVGLFFLKDYLDLSAAFIASIGFWAGIPWALKMPIGFIVDKFWSFKNYLVYLGAFVVFVSLLIMYQLLANREYMESMLPISTWFVVSAILIPIGYVIQDVVADAMTVEAVDSSKIGNEPALALKKEHTMVQLYGRFAIIFGTILVSALNLFIFYDIDISNKVLVNNTYAKIYFFSLGIPFISVSGIILSKIFNKKDKLSIKKSSMKRTFNRLDYKILIGSIVFVLLTLFLGLSKIPFSQEIILITSLILISTLINFLIKDLSTEKRNTIIGSALIIFVFRSMPGPGQGLAWFEIDILGFDQYFLSFLALISGTLTLLGMIIFRNFMIKTTLPRLFIILSIISSILFLPSIFMYYGLHNFTSQLTNGFVDQRFIALINSAVESPLSQVAMIPLLAWIARNAPDKYKATFFAVFASFTNLALSSRELFTKYLNKIYIIEREIIDSDTEVVLTNSNYDKLDELLITVLFITLITPILFIFLIQKTKFKSRE